MAVLDRRLGLPTGVDDDLGDSPGTLAQDPLTALVEQPAGVAALDLVTAVRLHGRLRLELDRLRDLDHALAARIAVLQIAPNEDRLYTAEEAAAVLNVTPDWLRRQKHFPARVVLSPGQVRYSRRAIERWIATRAGK